MSRAARDAVRRPTPPEIARAAVAAARVASVRVVCGRAGTRLVIARTEPSTAGEVTIHVDAGSPVVTTLAQGYAVAVTLAAPAPFSSLVAIGQARLQPDAQSSTHVFAIELAGLTLQGPGRRIAVDLEEFWALEEDPIAPDAPRMLAHLAAAHAAELTACVRAHLEPDATAVVPRSLDRFGLGLAVITADGVSDIVLGFPNAPVSSMHDVASYLRVALTCPCQPRTSP